ncbi:MAG: hypothetical protein ABSD03_11000 [Vulcanimicrobiaceae bacterium]|jgi:hypothetical protein
MKPWRCRECSEWNTGWRTRCETCGTRRERVDVAEDPQKAARRAAIAAQVPGLAGVLADLARAMRAYAAENELALELLNPEAIVSPGGRIVVELMGAT